MSQHAIVVPDIGDYSDVPVIEVLVKVGDAIEKEQPLIVLESDKATIEVPADQAGIVTSLTIKVGDKVSKGSVIGQLEVSAAASASIRRSFQSCDYKITHTTASITCSYSGSSRCVSGQGATCMRGTRLGGGARWLQCGIS